MGHLLDTLPDSQLQLQSRRRPQQCSGSGRGPVSARALPAEPQEPARASMSAWACASVAVWGVCTWVGPVYLWTPQEVWRGSCMSRPPTPAGTKTGAAPPQSTVCSADPTAGLPQGVSLGAEDPCCFLFHFPCGSVTAHSHQTCHLSQVPAPLRASAARSCRGADPAWKRGRVPAHLPGVQGGGRERGGHSGGTEGGECEGGAR